MATTIVIWAQQPGPEIIDQLAVKALAMTEEGKTDDIFEQTTVPQGVQVTRTWTTVEDAQEWVDFLAPYNPASTQIVP